MNLEMILSKLASYKKEKHYEAFRVVRFTETGNWGSGCQGLKSGESTVLRV
jgi:hypothetical protein